MNYSCVLKYFLRNNNDFFFVANVYLQKCYLNFFSTDQSGKFLKRNYRKNRDVIARISINYAVCMKGEKPYFFCFSLSSPDPQ